MHLYIHDLILRIYNYNYKLNINLYSAVSQKLKYIALHQVCHTITSCIYGQCWKYN